MKPTETTEYTNAVNMRDMIGETRRIACDFIVSSERGGAGYLDAESRIDAIVEMLASLSCVEDHFREIIEQANEAEREERSKAVQQ